jgi:hypothetical protein
MDEIGLNVELCPADIIKYYSGKYAIHRDERLALFIRSEFDLNGSHF